MGERDTKTVSNHWILRNNLTQNMRYPWGQKLCESMVNCKEETRK